MKFSFTSHMSQTCFKNLFYKQFCSVLMLLNLILIFVWLETYLCFVVFASNYSQTNSDKSIFWQLEMELINSVYEKATHVHGSNQPGRGPSRGPHIQTHGELTVCALIKAFVLRHQAADAVAEAAGLSVRSGESAGGSDAVPGITLGIRASGGLAVGPGPVDARAHDDPRRPDAGHVGGGCVLAAGEQRHGHGTRQWRQAARSTRCRSRERQRPATRGGGESG